MKIFERLQHFNFRNLSEFTLACYFSKWKKQKKEKKWSNEVLHAPTVGIIMVKEKLIVKKF